MNLKNCVDKILKFHWLKSIILIIISIGLFFYGLSHGYKCIDCPENFIPHLIMDFSKIIGIYLIITILYSSIKYFIEQGTNSSKSSTSRSRKARRN